MTDLPHLTVDRTEECVYAIAAEYPLASIDQQLLLVMQRSKGHASPLRAREMLMKMRAR